MRQEVAAEMRELLMQMENNYKVQRRYGATWYSVVSGARREGGSIPAVRP